MNCATLQWPGLSRRVARHLTLGLFLVATFSCAHASSLTLSGSGSSLIAQGHVSFAVPVANGTATDTSLPLGNSAFGAYGHWETPWEDSFNVFWLGFTLPTPSVAGYNLSFRDGPDWAETAVGLEAGVPDAGAFSLFETGGLEFTSGADSIWADFTFSSEIEWQFDGSLLTGSGTWAYTTSLATAEGESVKFSDLTAPMPNASAEPVPDSATTWGLTAIGLTGAAFLAGRSRLRSALRDDRR